MLKDKESKENSNNNDERENKKDNNLSSPKYQRFERRFLFNLISESFFYDVFPILNKSLFVQSTIPEEFMNFHPKKFLVEVLIYLLILE